VFVTKLTAVPKAWLADLCGGVVPPTYGCPNRPRCWTRRKAYRTSTPTSENARTDPKEAGPAELARLSLPIAAGFRRRPG
jgi:hypothetical protein